MKLFKASETPLEPVSHNPDMTKRVFVRNGQIRNLAFFSQSNIPPNGETADHAHTDMTEVFYVISGSGQAVINGASHALLPGCVLVIEYGDTHVFRNTGSEPLVMNYFGIVDERLSAQMV